MRLAIASIPDAYVMLALENDAWYWFVAAIALIIRAMHAFERAVMAAIENFLLYPFRRIHHTYRYHDSSMIEYYSATCAVAFALWISEGRAGQAYFSPITETIPWWAWATPSVFIGVSQGVSVQYGTGTTRATCAFLSFTLWLWLTAITYRHIGYAAIHAFSAPLMLAMWITIFMQLRGGDATRPR